MNFANFISVNCVLCCLQASYYPLTNKHVPAYNKSLSLHYVLYALILFIL